MKRLLDVVVPLMAVLVLLAISFTAFTAYVAYCGMHEFKLPDAFEQPPREDAARLGGVLASGLNWAMQVCGTILTVLGASLAIRRGPIARVLGSVVVVLAGAVLITQHWGAGIALGVVAVAIVVAMCFQQSPSEKGERSM